MLHPVRASRPSMNEHTRHTLLALTTYSLCARSGTSISIRRASFFPFRPSSRRTSHHQLLRVATMLTRMGFLPHGAAAVRRSSPSHGCSLALWATSRLTVGGALPSVAVRRGRGRRHGRKRSTLGRRRRRGRRRPAVGSRPPCQTAPACAAGRRAPRDHNRGGGATHPRERCDAHVSVAHRARRGAGIGAEVWCAAPTATRLDDCLHTLVL